MAPERKHASDAILDAARSLLTRRRSPRATIAAIAGASGAPPGTLNHRFGNRAAIMSATWLRAVERFHEHALRALHSAGDPVETAVALSTRCLPSHAPIRRTPGCCFPCVAPTSLAPRRTPPLDEMNAPLFTAMRDLTRAIYQRAMHARATASASRWWTCRMPPFAATCPHCPDGSKKTWRQRSAHLHHDD